MVRLSSQYILGVLQPGKLEWKHLFIKGVKHGTSQSFNMSGCHLVRVETGNAGKNQEADRLFLEGVVDSFILVMPCL